VQVPQAVVCLPTYNELENLEPMLRALGDKGVRVLVIDDNSPDGTGELADRLARELDYVDVLHREHKEGLGPAYLAGFRRALSDGADLVLEMDRLISEGGSLYARVLLGVDVRDLTGGFKCYRRAVLEAIDLDAVDSKGYAFQIETTYRALRAGFEVVEVPITFADREVGGSKMSKAIVAEAIWKVPGLRLAALFGRL
jgi:dolichol-phosphate mannosyltransferase